MSLNLSSNQRRDILILLRLVESRLCCDCDAPLSDVVFGSLTIGCWLCSNCSEVHKLLFNSKAVVKSSLDNWSDDEVFLEL